MIAGLLLAGCDSTETDMVPASYDGCGAYELRPYLGSPADSLPSLPEGARRILPGARITLDYNPERLNVDIDSEGNVARLWCG